MPLGPVAGLPGLALAHSAGGRVPAHRALPHPAAPSQPVPFPSTQLEVMERVANVLIGQGMLPSQLGKAIAGHAGQALAGA